MAKRRNDEELRSYELPLRGPILFACGRCQRKLKRGDDPAGMASLKKMLRRQRGHDGPRLRLLKVPCLKMCPKDGVTVSTTAQFARHECSILRTAEDVAMIYQQCSADGLANKSGELD